MMEYLWLLVAYILVLSSIFVSANSDGCSETSFIGCVTRIRLQRVPFDTNMLNVVFNVTTEAKLRQTCIAYSEALPCFRDRILQCGNDKQKRLLDEVAKIIKFFCSPTSTKTQQTFLKHGGCIGKVLQMPATTDCHMAGHGESKKLELCRQICYDKREFLCMMKIWISEQSLCTLIDTERNCGTEAGEFYQLLQTSVFTDSFPIICDHSSIVYTTTTKMSTTSTTTTNTTTATPPVEVEAMTVIKNHESSPTTTTMPEISTTTTTFQKPVPNYYSHFKTTTHRPMRIDNVFNASFHSNEPEHQFNRIVEVTALPPPFEFHSTEPVIIKTTKESQSHIQQQPDRPIAKSHPVTMFIDVKRKSTTVRPAEMQTIWRPWYLQGVDSNLESLSTTTEQSNLMSINELFSFEIFKKHKPTDNLGGRGSLKETDLTKHTYGWPLWNGSNTSCRIPYFVIMLCVFLLNYF